MCKHLANGMAASQRRNAAGSRIENSLKLQQKGYWTKPVAHSSLAGGQLNNYLHFFPSFFLSLSVSLCVCVSHSVYIWLCAALALPAASSCFLSFAWLAFLFATRLASQAAHWMLMEIRMMIAYPWVHENGDAAAAAAAISLIPSTTTTMRRCREPKLCVHLVGSACIFCSFLFFSISTGKSFPLLAFFSRIFFLGGSGSWGCRGSRASVLPKCFSSCIWRAFS